MQKSSPSQDPLAELRNLHLPQTIDTWPWAPGWYFLIAVLAITLSLSIYFLIKNRRNSLYKRQALIELEFIKKEYEHKHNIQKSAQAISALLKKVVLVHFSRSEVSSISGEPWLSLLDELSQSNEFTQGAGTLLGERLFKKITSTDANNGDSNNEIETLFINSELLIKKLSAKRLKGVQL